MSIMRKKYDEVHALTTGLYLDAAAKFKSKERGSFGLDISAIRGFHSKAVGKMASTTLACTALLRLEVNSSNIFKALISRCLITFKTNKIQSPNGKKPHFLN